jgi:hypothetical protein
MKLNAVLTWIMVASTAAIFGLWIARITGLLWWMGGGPVGAAFLTLVFGAMARIMTAARDRGKAVMLLTAGLGVCPAAYATWLGMIFWAGAQLNTNWLVAVGVCASLTAFTAWATLVALVMLIRVRFRWARYMRGAMIGVLLLLAASAAYGICRQAYMDYTSDWHGRRQFEEIMGRFCGALGILSGVGFMALVAASDPLRMQGEKAPDAERMWFHATCPRCGARGHLRTDGDACGSCGLQIKVVGT